MTNLLIVACVLIVLTIATYLVVKYFTKKQPNLDNDIQQYTQEELDNIKLAEELYNKDLRPVVVEKTKPQVTEELNVVEAEFVSKELKPEFPIDKPKKKRKYYPKKKKQ
jgi:predicted PurR-regulated permease PerM